MYDFEVKIKVAAVYEITYEGVVVETDQREGAYERKVVKTERFADWDELRACAYKLARHGYKILQVVEVKDATNRLKNEMQSQAKD